MQQAALCPPVDDPPWRRLLHRWLVEYNPLYLVSAALVLVGVVLSSQGLAGRGGVVGQLGITAIAELYAWVLIGGAALLARIGLRRPATMLSLLALFYQCDPTLHTETCALLGSTGALASALWLLGFVAKLRVLQWAMKLRLSRSAVAVALLGATFVAGFPWVLRVLDPTAASAWLGLAVFGVLAAGLWTHRSVHSRLAVTGWACLVTRRSVRATWAGWAVMVGVHVAFWISQHPRLDGLPTALALAMLTTRWLHRESRVWLAVGAVVSWTMAMEPSATWVAATLGAAVLLLRAYRCPRLVVEPAVPPAVELDDVYRSEPEAAAPMSPRSRLSFEVLDAIARRRLWLGALTCLYVAAWTHGWSGGPWPSHVPSLDAAVVVTTLAIAWRMRWWTWLSLPTTVVLHAVATSGLVPMPRSALQWGVACIGAGFGLLLLSLAVAVVWRPFRRRLPTIAAAPIVDAPS